jgi:hypothetical protein
MRRGSTQWRVAGDSFSRHLLDAKFAGPLRYLVHAEMVADD